MSGRWFDRIDGDWFTKPCQSNSSQSCLQAVNCQCQPRSILVFVYNKLLIAGSCWVTYGSLDKRKVSFLFQDSPLMNFLFRLTLPWLSAIGFPSTGNMKRGKPKTSKSEYIVYELHHQVRGHVMTRAWYSAFHSRCSILMGSAMKGFAGFDCWQVTGLSLDGCAPAQWGHNLPYGLTWKPKWQTSDDMLTKF